MRRKVWEQWNGRKTTMLIPESDADVATIQALIAAGALPEETGPLRAQAGPRRYVPLEVQFMAAQVAIACEASQTADDAIYHLWQPVSPGVG